MATLIYFFLNKIQLKKINSLNYHLSIIIGAGFSGSAGTFSTINLRGRGGRTGPGMRTVFDSKIDGGLGGASR